MAELTVGVVRHLYEEDLLTDAQIAQRLGTYQVAINRFRQANGILTIPKSGRMQLPPIKGELRSLLVGSMLGDGHLRRVSSSSVRFQEYHSTKQRSYLDWKVQRWGSWVTSISPQTKTVGEKVYRGSLLCTHAHHSLKKWWTRFYPEGKGSKIVPQDLVLNALILAVWFMDDGSGGKGPTISFGLDLTSREQAWEALKQFGIRVEWSSDRRDQSGRNGCFVVVGHQSLARFDALVRPHIPSCMEYKQIDLASFRPPIHMLVPVEELRALGSHRTVGEVASIYGVGKNTLGRYAKKLGVSFVDGRVRVSTEEQAIASLGMVPVEAWTGLDQSVQEQMIESVVQLLLKCSFPLVDPTSLSVPHQLTLLRQFRVHVKDGVIHGRSIAGQRICNAYFPNRFRARSYNKVSAFEAWVAPKHLRRAVRFQLRYGDPVIPRRVLRALVANLRTPTNFLPSKAMALYRYLLPQGGVILDPCAGWGGRLMAAVAGQYEYVGNDVEPETVVNLRRLHELIGGNAKIYQGGAETDLPNVEADLVFTSPPYFSQEKYSDDPRQSYLLYLGWGEWVERFLRPMVKNCADRLKVGGSACYVVSDVRQSGVVYPLVEETKIAAEAAGLTFREAIAVSLARLGRSQASEQALVFDRK